jgi:hypothetical protein
MSVGDLWSGAYQSCRVRYRRPVSSKSCLVYGAHTPSIIQPKIAQGSESSTLSSMGSSASLESGSGWASTHDTFFPG